MSFTSILKLIAVVNELSMTLPAVIAAVKGTMSSDDEAALKQALADQQAKNAANFEKAQAILEGIAQG